MKTSCVLGCVVKSKKRKVGMCCQIQKKKSLDCFTNGSNYLGLFKKDSTLRSMILNFDKKKFIQVEWHFIFLIDHVW